MTSAEGISGYNALFASRFSKLKKIISNRPESKMVKPIASVISTKFDEDVYVCGLVSERSSERNITKLVLDDPTGNIEIIVFDKDLRKEADTLLNDQLVMAKIAIGKNGGFITKDLVIPEFCNVSLRASRKN